MWIPPEDPKPNVPPARPEPVKHTFTNYVLSENDRRMLRSYGITQDQPIDEDDGA